MLSERGDTPHARVRDITGEKTVWLADIKVRSADVTAWGWQRGISPDADLWITPEEAEKLTLALTAIWPQIVEAACEQRRREKAPDA